MEINVDIRPTGMESAVAYAPFDVALEGLTERGYDIISLAQNAQLRVQQGKNAYVSGNGNWVKEGVIYIPKKGNKLVRVSPIIGSAREATQTHREGREFFPTKEQIEEALEDSIDYPESSIGIPTNRFDSDALAVYAFGGEDNAKVYGDFLREEGIKEMPVRTIEKGYVNGQNHPFATQTWFGSLGDRSGLTVISDWFRNLAGDGRLRGVKDGAVGTAPEK